MKLNENFRTTLNNHDNSSKTSSLCSKILKYLREIGTETRLPPNYVWNSVHVTLIWLHCRQPLGSLYQSCHSACLVRAPFQTVSKAKANQGKAPAPRGRYEKFDTSPAIGTSTLCLNQKKIGELWPFKFHWNIKASFSAVLGLWRPLPPFLFLQWQGTTLFVASLATFFFFQWQGS